MECLKECPSNTELDTTNLICKDKNNINDFILTENEHILFNENNANDLVSYYSNNYLYTEKHISSFTANNMTYTIYKDIVSIKSRKQKVLMEV